MIAYAPWCVFPRRSVCPQWSPSARGEVPPLPSILGNSLRVVLSLCGHGDRPGPAAVGLAVQSGLFLGGGGGLSLVLLRYQALEKKEYISTIFLFFT